MANDAGMCLLYLSPLRDADLILSLRISLYGHNFQRQR